jgi:hypothetical protein
MKMTHVQLHDLVRSTPLTKIPRQFGVRDQHVASACYGAEVAHRGTGYWQKVEHGKECGPHGSQQSSLRGKRHLRDRCIGLGNLVSITEAFPDST